MPISSKNRLLAMLCRPKQRSNGGQHEPSNSSSSSDCCVAVYNSVYLKTFDDVPSPVHTCCLMTCHLQLPFMSCRSRLTESTVKCATSCQPRELTTFKVKSRG